MECADALLVRLRAMPKAPPPSPWRVVAVHTVGGLTDIGYASDSDLLLVVSHDGRGVFDALTGERQARDRAPLDSAWHDPIHLMATGIGPLSDKRIRIAGLWGGGLTRITEDGWTLGVVSITWTDDAVFLMEPGKNVYRGEGTKLTDWDPVRAFGFSETGRSFAIAQAHTLYLCARIRKREELAMRDNGGSEVLLSPYVKRPTPASPGRTNASPDPSGVEVG